ncbi:MAG: FecR domain-containing protein [Phycisphaeraceae bacterium]
MSDTPDPSRRVPAELLSLCGKLRDQAITDAEAQRLSALLKASSEARRFFRAFMALASALENRGVYEEALDTERDEDQGIAVLFDLLLAERQAVVRLRVEASNEDQPGPCESGESSLSRGEVAGALRYLLVKWVRSAPARWAAAAAVVALVLTLSVVFMGGNRGELAQRRGPVDPSPAPLPTPAVAALTAEFGAVWERRPGQDLYAGQRFTLNAGMAEVTTASGAVLLLEAPATIELLRNDNAIRLHAGKLVGVCETQRSEGFVVHTPHMNIKDLGTRFGVDATAQATTRVHVFEGRVEAATPRHAGNSVHRQQLSSGMALAAGAGTGFKPVTFDPNRFVIDARLEAYRPDFAGTRVSWLGQLVGGLEQDQREADTLQVFIERRGTTLEQPVPVDFNADQPWDPQAPLGQHAVQAGVRVDVYLLHFDLVEGFEDPQQLVLDFGRPILGVIVSQDTLDATDAVLGAPGVGYPSFPRLPGLYGGGHRGLNYIPAEAEGDLVQPEYTNDLATISPSGTRLQLRLWGGHGEPWSKMDQVRVLVRSGRDDTDGPP